MAKVENVPDNAGQHIPPPLPEEVPLGPVYPEGYGPPLPSPNSQWHGELWSWGFNAVGNSYGAGGPPQWASQIRVQSGLPAAGWMGDGSLSYHAFGDTNGYGRWLSPYCTANRTPSRCIMWSGSRYPNNDRAVYDTGYAYLDSIQDISFRVGWIGLGRASDAGSEFYYVDCYYGWDNEADRYERMFYDPDDYENDVYGFTDRYYGRPGGGVGTFRIRLYVYAGSRNSHDVGDRGPGWDWAPVVPMGLPGAAYQGDLARSDVPETWYDYGDNV